MQTKEINFEQDIEQYLLSEGGYTKGSQATYDKKRAIDMTTLIQFIRATQPKQWKRYENIYGDKAEAQLYKVFQADVTKYGLIHVLRSGVKDRGVGLRFVYFAPASALNEELVEKYRQNIVTVTRQFAYSTENHNTIDMVLSVNGIPLVGLELKNQFTGQKVDDAKLQWQNDRDAKELIFQYNRRMLVYFCVDLSEVLMTTQLRGKDTHFLPFNQGSNGSGRVGDGGNPPNAEGYMTAYLWERVLRRDMLLSLLQRYISELEEKKVSIKNGKKVTETSKKIIFPRYHQLDVVEKLVADTRESKEGRNFLLQHSAGSGKSNSIAWLTYRLASLHDAEGREKFQTVFVVTDRRVLNSQLQNTILGFEHLEGQIATITDHDASSKLRDAINDKKRIVITTLHRFPLIYKELDDHAGHNFAIIVDEAHSSQSGKSAEKLKAALADTDEALRELAEWEEKTEEELKDEMDEMTETLLTQGQHRNLYFYAFTATPKPKTLQTFGTERTDGSFDAYHHYSMRQAIDEGFILDVLKYYTTIETSYEIAKTVSDDPEYDEPPATKAIKRYHDNHEYVLQQKVAVMVETFRSVTLSKLGGRGKAMIVSASRAHAVRYFFMLKDYCRQQGYTDVRALVAFSGSVKMEGNEYTEPQLNSLDGQKVTEAALPLYFGSDMYNVLIVADKYQTGFDEPLLHTMFVDKKLKGVKAVQTLSRLNRCKVGKTDTYILDFVNTAEDIRASFAPFYEDTVLIEGTDVNVVYQYRTDLERFHLWSVEDEEKVMAIYNARTQSSTDIGKLASALQPAKDAFLLLTDDHRLEVRSLLRNFIRFYAYMAQIARTFDKELYRSYIFAEYFFRALGRNASKSVKLEHQLTLISNQLTESFSGAITLKKGDALKPETGGGAKPKEEKRDLLTNIIDKINQMYGGHVNDADRVIIKTIFDKTLKASSKALKKQAKNCDANMFAENIFPKVFEKIAQSCYMESMDAFSKLFEDAEFYKRVMSEMAKAMYLSFKNSKASAFSLHEEEAPLPMAAEDETGA